MPLRAASVLRFPSLADCLGAGFGGVWKGGGLEGFSGAVHFKSGARCVSSAKILPRTVSHWVSMQTI